MSNLGSRDPFSGLPMADSRIKRKGEQHISPALDLQETDDFFNPAGTTLGSATSGGQYANELDLVSTEYAKLRGLTDAELNAGMYSDPYGIDRQLQRMKNALSSPDMVNKYNQANPHNPVKSMQEIEEQIVANYQARMQLEQVADESRDTLDKVQAFLSSGLGYLGTPENLAIAGAGGLAGATAKTLTGAFLKSGAGEAVAGLGLQGVNKPAEVEMREKAGEEVTAGQIAGEIAFETGIEFFAGGVFGTIFNLGARAFGYKAKPSTKIATQAEFVEHIKSPSSTAEGLTDLEHSQNLATATEQLSQQEVVNVPNGIAEKTADELPVLPEKAEQPERLNMETIAADKEIFIEIEEGHFETVNVRQALTEADAQIKVLEGIDKCMKGSR